MQTRPKWKANSIAKPYLQLRHPHYVHKKQNACRYGMSNTAVQFRLSPQRIIDNTFVKQCMQEQ